MFFLLSPSFAGFVDGSVEVSHSFDAKVVGFGGTGGENDFFGRGADERGHLGSGFFDGGFGFPAVAVSAGVWVSIGSNLFGLLWLTDHCEDIL